MTAREGDAPVLEARFSLGVGVAAGRFRLEVDLALARGLLVLFGPSGAGKSIALQALAGLVRPERGVIRLGDEVLYDSDRGIDVPAHRRGVGYVPQHHSLFPHLDVEGNVVFGLPRRERRRGNALVASLLEELGISRLARSRPAVLSGGERQRVALARALAVRPRLLLLDEPFASIDHEGREGLRSVLREVLDRHRVPAVFVTHDVEDALALGDRLVRFERGRSAEAGSPGALLRPRLPVVLAGEPAGEPRELPDGRYELRLGTATVTGTSEALRAVRTEGPLRVELHVPTDRAKNGR